MGYKFEERRMLIASAAILLMLVCAFSMISATTDATDSDEAHSITIEPSLGGTVTSNPKDTADAGATVTLTITPSTGYELKTLVVMSGETEVTVANNKFTMPDGNVTVTATFEKIDYTITIIQGETVVYGIITSDPSETANMGDKVTLTFTPLETFKDKYKVIWAVEDDEGEEVAVADNKFTMPASDVKVSATIAIIHSIAVEITPQGSGTVTVASQAATGEEVTVKVSPASGYASCTKLYYKVEGSIVERDILESKKFTMPDKTVTIYAEFEPKTIEITLDSNGGTEDGKATVVFGTSEFNLEQLAIFEGNVCKGYYTAASGTDAKMVLDKNGKLLTTDVEGYIKDGKWINPSDKVTLYAQWEKVTVTFKNTIGGKLSPDTKTYLVTNGSEARVSDDTLVFYLNGSKIYEVEGIPNEGYFLKCWKVAGKEMSDPVKITAPIEFTAEFAVEVESVNITETEKSITYQSTYKLNVTVLPIKAPKDLIWTSSNESVAIVSDDGVVTAKGHGTAIITATSKYNPLCKDTCLITVNTEINKIEISTLPTKTQYTVGDKFDPTGMVILATHIGGNTETISGDSGKFRFSPESLNDSGKITVTVTLIGYPDVKCTLEVEVQEKSKMLMAAIICGSLTIVALCFVAFITFRKN